MGAIVEGLVPVLGAILCDMVVDIGAMLPRVARVRGAIIKEIALYWASSVFRSSTCSAGC